MSEQRIDEMVETILHHEGGFVNDPADPGGATNFGVTIHTYSKWLKRKATVDEVRNMSKDTAIEIYKSKYYYDPRINTLNELVQPLVFDMAINHGPRNGNKMLQRTVNLAGFGPISVDGVIGPGTRRALDSAVDAMGNYFVNALVEERLKFYNRIVARRPASGKFLRGWTKRANSFRLPV